MDNAMTLEDEKKSLREQIISILSEEYPLPVKRIANTLRRRYNRNVSFQGVYKTVNRLVDEGVLVKDGREVSISKSWILELRNYAEKLHTEYFMDSEIESKVVVSGDIRVYSFKSLTDYDQYTNKLIDKYVMEESEGDDRPIVWWGGHCWWLICHLEVEDKFVRNVIKKDKQMYWLSVGNTFLDQLPHMYYRGKSLHYKSGGNGDEATYITVIGDSIVETRYPKHIAEKIAKFYKSVKSYEDIDLPKLMSIIDEEVDVNITVIKNRLLADKLRQEVLAQF